MLQKGKDKECRGGKCAQTSHHVDTIPHAHSGLGPTRYEITIEFGNEYEIDRLFWLEMIGIGLYNRIVIVGIEWNGVC